MINLQYQLDQKGGSDIKDLIQLCNGVKRVSSPSMYRSTYNDFTFPTSYIDESNKEFENAINFMLPRCSNELLKFFYKCAKKENDNYVSPWNEIVVNENCGKMINQEKLYIELDKEVSVPIKTTFHNGEHEIKQLLYAKALLKGRTYTKTIVKYFFNELLIRLLLMIQMWTKNKLIILDYNINNGAKDSSEIFSDGNEYKLSYSKYFNNVPISLDDNNNNQDVVIFLTDLVNKYFKLNKKYYNIIKRKNPKLFFTFPEDMKNVTKEQWNLNMQKNELLRKLKIRLGFSYISSSYLGYKEIVYLGYNTP